MVVVTKHGEPPPTHRQIDLAVDKARWQIPCEVPVAFVYNRRNYAVMLATPSDLEDFAYGFSLTERVIDTIADISRLDIHYAERGVELQFTISPARLERLDARQKRRNLVGRAGCGVCGLENADEFFETLPKVAAQPAELSQAALGQAAQLLDERQPLNALTRSVHGAGWADLKGGLMMVREDVGRHNALDKLLGGLAASEADISAGFVLMSSRCSYEIVEKAARRGVRAVAALSGPTDFAIRKATEANLTLYCRNGDGFVRVVGGSTPGGG